MGKDNFTYDNAGKLPLVSIHKTNIIIRALLLNAMNVYYKKIWEKCFINVKILIAILVIGMLAKL